jgi:hypothetical protein
MIKRRMDCPVKPANDKEEQPVMLFPLSFSCEHGRDTGIQEINELDYPIKLGNDTTSWLNKLGKGF